MLSNLFLRLAGRDAGGTSVGNNQTMTSCNDGGSYGGFKSPEHYMFQLANLLFLLSFVSPNGRYGTIFLHSCLVLGYIMYAVWAWSIICVVGLLGWSSFYIVVNLIQVLYLIFSLREVTFASEELEGIYMDLFEPMKISRGLFKRLVSSEFAQIMFLPAGEAYAMQNVTKTDRLSLLITGRVNVISGANFLHSIGPGEFLDSPEFDSYKVGMDSKFKVTIIASTDCTYVCWQRQSLDYLLVKEKFLSHVLSYMLAKDVADKLFAMNEKIVTEKGAHLDIRLPAVTTSLCNSMSSLGSGENSAGPSPVPSSARSSGRNSICSLRINRSLPPPAKSSRSKSLQVNSLAPPIMFKNKRLSTGSIFSSTSSHNGGVPVLPGHASLAVRRASYSPSPHRLVI